MRARRLRRVRGALGEAPASPANATIARLCTLLGQLTDKSLVDVELRRLETLARVLRARGELNALLLDVLADIVRVIEDAHAAQMLRRLVAAFDEP